MMNDGGISKYMIIRVCSKCLFAEKKKHQNVAKTAFFVCLNLCVAKWIFLSTKYVILIIPDKTSMLTGKIKYS